MSRPFRVVTHKRWLAESFAEFGAKQDFGFDINPGTARDTIWWAPGAWVASAAKAGITLPLMACGPRWLDALPRKYTGREIVTIPLSDAHTISKKCLREHDQVFVKLPEAKIEPFPAALHGTKHLADTLMQYHLPSATLIQIQEPVKFVAEARFWIAHREVTAWSWYRISDDIWGSEEWAPPPATDGISRRFIHQARTVIEDESIAVPPGFVLDIGLTIDGKWIVVEANAAWSSGPYDGNPAGIYRAIIASHDFDGRYPEWAWQGNPVFAHAGPLKVSTAA